MLKKMHTAPTSLRKRAYENLAKLLAKGKEHVEELRGNVASVQVTVQQAITDKCLVSESTETTKRTLHDTANRLSLRVFALKAVVDNLEQQQQLLDAATVAGPKQLA